MGFDPVTIGLVVSAASTAMGAVGARNQNLAAQYQRDYAADLQEKQVAAETIRTKENKKRLMDDRRRYLESARLRMSARGVDPDRGSPLAVLGEITSRADERIYDFAEDAAQRIGLMADKARITRWEGAQYGKAATAAFAGNLMQGTVQGVSAYREAKKRYKPRV